MQWGGLGFPMRGVRGLACSANFQEQSSTQQEGAPGM